MQLRNRFTRFSVPHMLLMLICVALFGCDPTTRNPSSTYLYVVDYSGSTATARKQQLGLMLAELESAPDDTEVVIYRMGSDTEEVFSGGLGDAGTDALMGTLKHDLIRSDSKEGTNFAKMAEAVAAFSTGFTGKSWKLRIMTDGGNDFTDAKSLKAYREGAAKVTADKRLSSIIFYGVEPEFRHEIRAVFTGAGSRLQILSGDQTIDE